jgi:hypothetical protein
MQKTNVSQGEPKDGQASEKEGITLYPSFKVVV